MKMIFAILDPHVSMDVSVQKYFSFSLDSLISCTLAKVRAGEQYGIHESVVTFVCSDYFGY